MPRRRNVLDLDKRYAHLLGGLPEAVARGPVKKGVKEQPRRTGGLKRLGMGRTGQEIYSQPAPVSPLAEAAAQVDLSGRGRTGQQLYAQPGGPLPPEQAGMDAAATQEYIQRRTREPFGAAVLTPFAHQQQLIQEASRLRMRRNVAESEQLADLRMGAQRTAWTERLERGGRPSNVLAETAEGLPLVQRQPPGMRIAPEPVTAQQQQDDWVAERRFGEQAVSRVLGDVDDASAVWTGIVQRMNAGQALSDSDIDIAAAFRVLQRGAQRQSVPRPVYGVGGY